MKKILLILGLVVFASSVIVVSGQEVNQGRPKRARTLEDYQPRTLADLISMKPDEDDQRDMRGQLVVTRKILPSKVQVTYTGEQRPISEAKKETIRQWARLYAGYVEHYTEPYELEMRFTEKDESFWLPVPKPSDLLRGQVKKGALVDLYIIRMGAAIVDESYDWTFLVEHTRISEAETKN